VDILLSLLACQTQSEDSAKQILDEVGFALQRISDTERITYRTVQENENGKEEHLASIQNHDYAEYAIKTLKKTIKQEDALVRQICYTGLSAYG
jgi:riboflavin synthase